MVLVKMILSKGYLENQETLQVNTHIVYRFLASMLDVQTPKAEAKIIVCKLFKKELLGSLDEILQTTLLVHGVPQPCYPPLVKVPSEVIKIYPLLMELKGMDLVRHRQITTYGVSFPKKLLMLETINDFDWVPEFDQFTKMNSFQVVVGWQGRVVQGFQYKIYSYYNGGDLVMFTINMMKYCMVLVGKQFLGFFGELDID